MGFGDGLLSSLSGLEVGTSSGGFIKYPQKKMTHKIIA
jgi:hypothetical protein